MTRHFALPGTNENRIATTSVHDCNKDDDCLFGYTFIRCDTSVLWAYRRLRKTVGGSTIAMHIFWLSMYEC